MIFPENIILFFRGSFSKKYIEMWYFLQIFWNDSLSKKKSHWNMIFLVLSGKMEFLLPENLIFLFFFVFLFRLKMKGDLSKEIHRNMIFFVYMYKCCKYDITLLPKKSKKEYKLTPSFQLMVLNNWYMKQPTYFLILHHALTWFLQTNRT